jgi:hypothetical protein
MRPDEAFSMVRRVLLLSALVAASAGANARVGAAPQPPDVDALLARLDDLYRSKSSIARMEILVANPRTTRTIRMKAWTRGEEKVLVAIEARQALGDRECLCPVWPRAARLSSQERIWRRAAIGPGPRTNLRLD